MKAKPFFKERKGWAIDKSLLGGGWVASKKHLSSATHRVTVQDARRPSALNVAERILQEFYDLAPKWCMPEWSRTLMVEVLAVAAKMTATIRKGRVKCDWRDK